MSRVLVLCLLLVGSSARADTGVTAVVAYGAAGLAAAIFDTAYTIYDVSRLSRGEPGTGLAGVFEVVGALPQIAGAALVVAKGPPWEPARPLAVVWGLWATALAAHGIWSIASGTPRENAAQLAISPLGCAGTWRF